MLDGQLRYYETVLDKVFRATTRPTSFTSREVQRMHFDPYCLGPRRSYVEHYGDAEIKPFRPRSWIPRCPIRPYRRRPIRRSASP